MLARCFLRTFVAQHSGDFINPIFVGEPLQLAHGCCIARIGLFENAQVLMPTRCDLR